MKIKCQCCGADFDKKIRYMLIDVTKSQYCDDCRKNEAFEGTIEIKCNELLPSIGYWGHNKEASVTEFNHVVDNIVDVNNRFYRNKNAIERPRVVQIVLNEPEVQLMGFPMSYEDRYLILKEDIYSADEEDGLHRIGIKEYRIPLHRISMITVKKDCEDVYVQDVREPIIGYKAVTEVNGMLVTHGYVYEIGVPYEEPQRNPYKTNYQDCYSHFCKRIEDVELCSGKTGFLESQARQRLNFGNDLLIRLFKVKAEKHCIQNDELGWVTNKLTLLEEVTHEELIHYFNNNVSIREKLVKYINDMYGESFTWADFENTKIEPYKMEYQSEGEIYEKAIKRCFDFGKEQCKQDICNIDKEVCDCCEYSKYPNCYKGNADSLVYMIMRYRILQGKLQKEELEHMEQMGTYDKKLIEAWYRLLHVQKEIKTT